MLDTQTKKRIDDCRDILVGKLPDPKAQIEQITIGLIYKFMDDMDKEAIELGGQAKFFSGDYEKYAWDKLFDTKVTAAEMLRLYSTAIESMEKNPNIPPLFRDIFNNAYLPYRDPETLKLFLKTIGEFAYTHSEKLGDAFEYLLSVMGSQGDAGQFRTPRHIIDFLVAIVDPDKGQSILDPACGTAGFLISAYKHILLKHTKANKEGLNIYAYNKLEKKPFNDLGGQLTPDERKKLNRHFAGYDISPDMVRLSLVNLYLHGFPDPAINEYDTLSSEERWNENYDVILANPPFMSPKGGIRPHKKFTISSNRSEVLFVDYIAEHLNPRGKAGIIVPEGVIFQSGTAYKELRKMLVDNYLYAVVSLPAGVFNPYSGVKTSILLMDKEVSKKRDEILFVKIDNDGYNLGAQRTAVKGSQLEEAIALAHAFVASGEIPDSPIAHAVTKAKIAANGDYNLSGERYRVNDILNYTSFKTEELGNIVEVLDSLRRPISKSDRIEGKYPYYGATGILDYVHDYIFDEKLVLVGEDGAKWLPGDKTAFMAEGKYWVNNHAHVLRTKRDKVLDLFLVEMLNYMDLSPFITGVTVPKLNQAKLRSIKIPLPPISIQEEIVAEIEGYQKIIDGAKAVVANYKPKIEIDLDWEMVELGEVCEVNPKKSEIKEIDDKLEVSFVPMADLNENQIDFIPTQSKQLSEVYKGYTYFKENDVLLAKVTPCFENGKAGIAKGLSNGIGFGSSEYFVFRPSDKILSTWIYLNIITDTFRIRGKLNMTGTGGLQRVPPGFVKSTLIPLPDIETQRQIVAQIEKEQALVDANKQLIEIFEQKIKDRIARVWGVADRPGASTGQADEDVPLSMAAEPGDKYLKH